MTSEATKSQTEKFFDKHDFFGLNEKNVVIFEQFTLPCINFDGKILLSEKHKVACSPGKQFFFQLQYERHKPT